MIDFSQIEITDDEYVLLEKIESKKLVLISEVPNSTLKRFKDSEILEENKIALVNTDGRESPAISIEFARNGLNFFYYCRNAREKDKKETDKERRQFRHDWMIAIFSAFAGALLSKPLWTALEYAASIAFDFIWKE